VVVPISIAIAALFIMTASLIIVVQSLFWPFPARTGMTGYAF